MMGITLVSALEETSHKIARFDLITIHDCWILML